MSSLTKLNQSLDDIITQSKSKHLLGTKKPKRQQSIKKKTVAHTIKKRNSNPVSNRAKFASKLEITIHNDRAHLPASVKSVKKRQNRTAKNLVVSVQQASIAPTASLSDRFQQQRKNGSSVSVPIRIGPRHCKMLGILVNMRKIFMSKVSG